MSDDEDFLDDDEWLYWDDDVGDGLAAWADDLAEHTVHSPVWRDNDPAAESRDYWSDWEYYSDDYYDVEKPANAKANPADKDTAKLGSKRKRLDQYVGQKRQKLNSAIPGHRAATTQADPIIRWREPSNQEVSVTVQTRHLEKVSLIKDWKERFERTSGKASIAHRSTPADTDTDLSSHSLEHLQRTPSAPETENHSQSISKRNPGEIAKSKSTIDDQARASAQIDGEEGVRKRKKPELEIELDEAAATHDRRHRDSVKRSKRGKDAPVSGH